MQKAEPPAVRRRIATPSSSSSSSESQPVRKPHFPWPKESNLCDRIAAAFSIYKTSETFFEEKEIDFLNFIESSYTTGTLLYPYSQYTLTSLLYALNDLKMFQLSTLSPSVLPKSLAIQTTLPSYKMNQRRDNIIVGVHIYLQIIIFTLTDFNLENKMKKNREFYNIPTKERYSRLSPLLDEITGRPREIELPSAVGLTVGNLGKERLDPKFEENYDKKYTRNPNIKNRALGYSPYTRSLDQQGQLEHPMPFKFILETFYGIEVPPYITENETITTSEGWRIQQFNIELLRNFFWPDQVWFEKQEERLYEKVISDEEYHSISDWKEGDTKKIDKFGNLFYYLPILKPKSMTQPIVLFHGVGNPNDEFFIRDAFGRLSPKGELKSLLATSWWPGSSLVFSTKKEIARKTEALLIRLFIRHPVHAIFISSAFQSIYDGLLPTDQASNLNEREIVLKPGIFFRPRRTKIIRIHVDEDNLDEGKYDLTAATDADSHVRQFNLKNVDISEKIIPQIRTQRKGEKSHLNILKIADYETYDPAVEGFFDVTESVFFWAE